MNEIDLWSKFPELKPVSGVPAQWRISGFGVWFYGSRDHDVETNSHVRTQCICALYIPILALRSYRICETTEGGLVLGREPISVFAKSWNALALISLVAYFGFVAWQAQMNSPEQVAQRRLDDAIARAETGDVVGAAWECRDVAVQPPQLKGPAAEAAGKLVTGPLRHAAPRDAAAALEILVDWSQEVGSPMPPDLIVEATKIAEQHAEADPLGAIAILDAVTPLAADDPKLLTRRRTLAERAIARSPDDLEAIARLAESFEAAAEYNRCRELLTPHRARLGSTEGARILGQICARQGDDENANELLVPYTEERLKRLHDAEESYRALIEKVRAEIIENIKNRRIPDSLLRQLQHADREEQARLINEYSDAKLRNDRRLSEARVKMVHESAVVPVALDLGIVQLNRAHNMSDAAARQQELQRVETTFLAVRGFAGETDQFRLHLGRVYYWLGKPDEGRRLLDELLNDHDRKHELLLAVANTLRDLGATGDARTLAEEAYNRASDAQQKYHAALLRGITPLDPDDQVKWLRLTDPGDPMAQAELNHSLATQAIRKGNDEEAASYLRRSVNAYARELDHPATLNNCATAYSSLYAVTGDAIALKKRLELLERAVQVDPSNPIALANLAHALLENAVREVIDNRIDLSALKSTADTSLLRYLYSDKMEKDHCVEQIRAHPSVPRAVRCLERTLILAPGKGQGYAELAAIHEFFDATPDLETLWQRLQTASIDTSESLRVTQEYYQGKQDATNRPSIRSEIVRAEQRVQAARTSQSPVTFAVAAGRLLDSRNAQFEMGDNVDADQLIQLAEEAHAAAPSAATESHLIAALLLRATGKLAAAEPEFGETFARTRRALRPHEQVCLALSRPGNARDAALRDADVQRAMRMTLEQFNRFPEAAYPSDWAMLTASYPHEAARVAQLIRQDESAAFQREIYLRLNPANTQLALHAYWAKQSSGDLADAIAILQRLAAQGSPMPVDPK